MTKHFLNCSVRAATAALCLGAMINGTTAGSFTRGCAARDLQILMLIEERESTNAILAERLSDAMFMMMDARMTCREGHEADALTMYDNVAGSLTPSINRRTPPSLINGAAAGSFTRGCAARDLQILKVIKERENVNAISVEQVSDTMITILNARMICYEGHVVDALAIYDDVARSLTPHNLRQNTSPNLITSQVR
jgi:hypothetical protein